MHSHLFEQMRGWLEDCRMARVRPEKRNQQHRKKGAEDYNELTLTTSCMLLDEWHWINKGAAI